VRGRSTRRGHTSKIIIFVGWMRRSYVEDHYFRGVDEEVDGLDGMEGNGHYGDGDEDDEDVGVEAEEDEDEEDFGEGGQLSSRQRKRDGEYEEVGEDENEEDGTENGDLDDDDEDDVEEVGVKGRGRVHSGRRNLQRAHSVDDPEGMSDVEPASTCIMRPTRKGRGTAEGSKVARKSTLVEHAELKEGDGSGEQAPRVKVCGTKCVEGVENEQIDNGESDLNNLLYRVTEASSSQKRRRTRLEPKSNPRKRQREDTLYRKDTYHESSDEEIPENEGNEIRQEGNALIEDMEDRLASRGLRRLSRKPSVLRSRAESPRRNVPTRTMHKPSRRLRTSDPTHVPGTSESESSDGSLEPIDTRFPLSMIPRIRVSTHARRPTMERVIETRKTSRGAHSIEPVQVDLDVGWDSIGGLHHHIRALKEMVFLPLMYPEVFEKFKMEPPKGVLFYGPPGTGKTLCARALAASCGVVDGKPSGSGDGKETKRARVSFFMRNGADCLSKWVGEAERQLRLTFEAAKANEPSIIFFDEIDGLAPVRSSRQDQVHSSIVSTLLGLMDGLEARGRIVVIGATNRVDAIDPALRRPGRFDRELIFTLPSVDARENILKIHTKKWDPAPDHAMLAEVAKTTVGYCGADLKSLCVEAALTALRRRYPQIYDSNDKLLISPDEVKVTSKDFFDSMSKIIPASNRAARIHARPLGEHVLPLLQSARLSCLQRLKRIFPQGFEPCDRGNPDGLQSSALELDFESLTFRNSLLPRLTSPPMHRPRLLLHGFRGLGQDHLGLALLYCLERCNCVSIDLPSLHSDPSAKYCEEALVNAVREASKTAPSILYLPHVDTWWENAMNTLRATLVMALRDIPPGMPILVLSTSDRPVEQLPPEVVAEFSDRIPLCFPDDDARVSMFSTFLEVASRVLPVRTSMSKPNLEVLPKAPSPLPKNTHVRDKEKSAREEDAILRLLRMEMRDIIGKFLNDRKYKVFCDPVDPVIAPDYYDIVKEPIDLSTIAFNIDRGKYTTLVQLVSHIDLLVKNAIDYNPPETPEGASILRKAHSLVDYVHAWADSLDEELVRKTNEIYNRTKATELSGNAIAGTPPTEPPSNPDTLDTQPDFDEEAKEAGPDHDVQVSKETGEKETDEVSSKMVGSDGDAVINGNATMNDVAAQEDGMNVDLHPPQGGEQFTQKGVENGPIRVEGPVSGDGSHGSQNLSFTLNGKFDRDDTGLREIAPLLPSLEEQWAVEQEWLKCTRGWCVEALEYAGVKLHALLRETLAEKDRRSVLQQVREMIFSLSADPVVPHLSLVGTQ